MSIELLIRFIVVVKSESNLRTRSSTTEFMEGGKAAFSVALNGLGEVSIGLGSTVGVFKHLALRQFKSQC